MAKPDTIVIGGHGYSWQQLCEMRRQQLEAWEAAQPRQLALFELHEDRRPAAGRTAAGRYHEPTLFADMDPFELKPRLLLRLLVTDQSRRCP
jgi:hypothetical protein